MPQRKPYNPNTAYGRKKLREQAEYNYENGTDEYRYEIDNYKNWFWVIILGLCVIVFVIIWNVSGPEAAIDWAK